MAVKTKQQLRDYADANRNTNGVQALTGATENVMWNDVIDTFATEVNITSEIAAATLLNNEIVLSENIPVDGVTSTQLTWLGESRLVASGQTGSYSNFACNNQHAVVDVRSLTGAGTITFTGVSVSETDGIPTAAVDEVITVDATGLYQTDTKWLEIISITPSVGTLPIDYDVYVLGYIDIFNADFKLLKMRADILSGGINSDISIRIIKVQNDGDGKMSLVDVEHYGIDSSAKSYVDDLRTGGDDRSYTTTSSLWVSGENACLKVSDYDTYFTNDENVFEGATKAEGFIIRLEGTTSGNINNVAMLNLHLTFQLI